MDQPHRMTQFDERKLVECKPAVLLYQRAYDASIQKMENQYALYDYTIYIQSAFCDLGNNYNVLGGNFKASVKKSKKMLIIIII